MSDLRLISIGLLYTKLFVPISAIAMYFDYMSPAAFVFNFAFGVTMLVVLTTAYSIAWYAENRQEDEEEEEQEEEEAEGG